MISPAAKQLTLALIHEIIADKKRRNIVPGYALQTEIRGALNNTLHSLVADGTLVEHHASVNRIPAYEIPCQREQK